MSKMIAPCGLVCTHCPAFIATQNDDDEARARAAAFYNRIYGIDLLPEEINCDGCLTIGGKRIGYCRICTIRKCCLQKGIASCAHCDEQPCVDLKAFHAYSPQAKDCFAVLLEKVTKG